MDFFFFWFTNYFFPNILFESMTQPNVNEQYEDINISSFHGKNREKNNDT